jgi:hypothetical protein
LLCYLPPLRRAAASTAARPTTGTATAATMPPAPLACGTTSSAACSCRTACFRGRRIRCAIRTVEVWFFAAFYERLIILEVFATFDGDGAGIRGWLPFHR